MKGWGSCESRVFVKLTWLYFFRFSATHIYLINNRTPHLFYILMMKCSAVSIIIVIIISKSYIAHVSINGLLKALSIYNFNYEF